MKKIILLMCLCGFGIPPKAAAVMPPSTMLEEENQPLPSKTAIDTAPQNPRQLSEKLEMDERHLEEVLQDIQQARKTLKDIKEKKDEHQ